MTPVDPLAVLICLGLVTGLALVVTSAPFLRRPRLANRLDPYLRGLEYRRTRLLEVEERPLTPFPALERLLRPLLAEGSRAVERWVGGSASVARRLREAGREETTARFRAEQVLWGLGGFAAALVMALVLPLAVGSRPRAITVLGAVVAGVLGGVLGRDWRLTQEVKQRQARMLSEFPTVADLLCLAVTAGESPRGAIERVVARCRGEFSRELERVLADLRTGTPFATAMERLTGRVPIQQVVRFVDGMVVAVERGTPLADVLRAQAQDVREQQKRELLQAGGKKEVYMLVPVVFLILPVVVLFALFPGFFSLTALAR